MKDDPVGDRFQRGTWYTREEGRGGEPPGKVEQGSSRRCRRPVRTALPPPVRDDVERFDAAVRARRSVRRFAAVPLAVEDLSFLLWASAGIRDPRAGGRMTARSAPSAGALYPIETYLAVHDIDGLDPGIWRYHVPTHSLDLLRRGDVREEGARAALDQRMAGEAPVLFVWTAVFARTVRRYGQRGYRYIYLDAGHIGAHLSLAAASIGLGSCQIGALYDDECNALVGVDGERESVIYMSAVGRPA